MSSKKSPSSNHNATATIKLIIGAGQAAPTPPIGPALGQKGVKAIEFCRQFNESTSSILPGTPLPTLITVASDRTFSYITKTPTAVTMLKKAAGLVPNPSSSSSKHAHKSSNASTSHIVAQLTPQHLYEIAFIKQKHDPLLRHLPLCSIFKMMLATARSIGIEITRIKSL
jgi:large subunit ribosomal protein L11